MIHVKLVENHFTLYNHYDYTEKLYKDYLSDIPGTEIHITEQELLRENKDNGNWPEEYLESLAFYRKICEYLLDKNILLFHCSAIAMDGKAYLFTAPSGTGKSTHVRLWKERFGDRVTVINDDKPLLSVGEKEIRVFGTPYGGKHGLQTNTSAPVAAVIILHQSEENKVFPMSRREAYPVLLNQTYRRNDPAGLLKTMDLVNKVAELPVYSLACNISTEAVTVIYEQLQKLEQIKRRTE